MVSRIFLLRHGETKWSLSGKHTGSTDLPLTKEGERSARLLHGRLRGTTFSFVFTSPLQRARRTCELAELGTASAVEADLHEWDYGAHEGRRTVDIHKESPGWNIFQHGCPGGESVAQVAQRADRLLGRLRALDGVVALVAHAHFLRVLTARWLGEPVALGRHLFLETGSISVLGFEHDAGTVPGICLWNAGSDLAVSA
jgi:probable phosphoglycerate mutase